MTALYRVDLTAATNADLRQSFALADTAGTAIDLTGVAISFAAEHEPGAAVLAASTTNGRIVVTNALLGRFDLVIPAAALAPIAPGLYQHDLLLTRTGRVDRIWSGTLRLEHGVTV